MPLVDLLPVQILAKSEATNSGPFFMLYTSYDTIVKM